MTLLRMCAASVRERWPIQWMNVLGPSPGIGALRTRLGRGPTSQEANMGRGAFHALTCGPSGDSSASRPLSLG
jgi:hypothetical protein